MTAWAEYKITRGHEVTCNNIIEAEEKPAGNWWGPFHCRECARNCANLGMTERQAYDFNHGTPDEVFCAVLDIQ